MAQKFHLGHNFAVDFMGFMDEYKKDFEKRTKVKWEYSNSKLLERYTKFKRGRESFSRNDDGGKEGGMIEMQRV